MAKLHPIPDLILHSRHQSIDGKYKFILEGQLIEIRVASRIHLRFNYRTPLAHETMFVLEEFVNIFYTLSRSVHDFFCFIL